MNNSTVLDDDLDHDLVDRVTALDLYRRWESQQWQAYALDYRADRAAWERLPEFARRGLVTTLARFQLGEQTVAEVLSPLAYAAPDPDYKLFLGTQLADEARHALFFRNYIDTLDGVLTPAETADVSGIARVGDLFETVMADSVERVRIRPTDREAWYTAIAVYHFLAEITAGLTGMHSVLATVRALPQLGTLRTGCTNVARDESRHVAFGVLALRAGVRAGYRDHIVETVRRYLPAAARTMVYPEYRDPFPALAMVRAKRAEFLCNEWEFAAGSLTRRMASIGFPEDVVPELEELWHASCAAAAVEYEGIHGEPHPTAFLAR